MPELTDADIRAIAELPGVIEQVRRQGHDLVSLGNRLDRLERPPLQMRRKMPLRKYMAELVRQVMQEAQAREAQP
jgi:hypothetical protein